MVNELPSRTSAIHIREQTSLRSFEGIKPQEILNELLSSEDGVWKMSFVIENCDNFHEHEHPRRYNLFIVDGYDSFR